MLGLSTSGVRWLARVGRLACETTQAGQRLFRPSEVKRFADRRMQTRLTGVTTGRRWIRGEPRQLSLFGATLRIVGEAKHVLTDAAAKGPRLLKETS